MPAEVTATYLVFLQCDNWSNCTKERYVTVTMADCDADADKAIRHAIKAVRFDEDEYDNEGRVVCCDCYDASEAK